MIKSQISRRPLFWVALLGIFIGGSVFSFKYFSTVFPIVNLDITIDRQAALQKAKELALQYHWGPKGFEQTASFSVEEMTKNFIELEGGGKEAFNMILAEKYYAPYTWNVRHFKEHDATETTIKFTPEGKPYGFEEKIPENTPGAALSSEAARLIAIETAQSDWQIDFSIYILVESSQETKPSGRIDHTFVYERTDKKVGEAPYRLRLVVSGDTLTEISLFIKIPEAFTRRYEHMRSANNIIAQAAGTIVLLLYFLGGCLLGLFYLLRRRWVLWVKPFLCSSFIGILFVLNSISQFPLLWLHYDTALDKNTIYIKFIINLLATFGGVTLALGLIFAAAESLTRMAFGNQPQLWKVWSGTNAASIQTLGRTLGGYFIIGFDFSFIIIFYFITTHFFGWWTPSSALIDPNILATYFPWVNAVSLSLFAGSMEECLFRAIPLSCAAIIGKKRGNRTAWIIGAFILQAIIFSAAHANYPAQPAYARLIELLIPSSVFGGIYLAFGLLPAIISHFTYDVILYSLPIFLSTDLFFNKIIVISLSLIPLWIILISRLKKGYWSELAHKAYNAAWQPSEKQHEVTIMEKPEKVSLEPTQRTNKLIIFGGLIGLACWLFTTQFKQDGIPLAKKSIAQDVAVQALAKKNIIFNAPWQQFTTAVAQINEQHRFIWTTHKSLYWPLLQQHYLSSAEWQIRYAHFDGDIINRAEEYTIFLNPLTYYSPIRIAHRLPESQAGKELSESDARSIAHTVLKNEYHLEPANLEEISAISEKKPERIDWIFTFSNPTAYRVTNNSLQGQARIAILIAGNEVVDHYQYVFVPEQWQREDRQQQTTYQLLVTICLILLAMLLIFSGIQAIISWVHHNFAVHTFLLFFGMLVSKSIIQFFNLFPVLVSGFKTSEPYTNQLLTLAMTLVIQIMINSASLALLAGFIQSATMQVKSITTSLSNRVIIGFSLGSILAGFTSLAFKLSPSTKPLWADYTHAAAQLPGLSFALTSLTGFISGTILLYIVLKAIDYITQGGTSRLYLGILSCITLGILLRGTPGIDNLAAWLVTGVLYGLLLYIFYMVTLRFDRTLIPLTMGAFMMFQLFQQGIFNAYPGAFFGSIFSIILIMLCSLWWSNRLEIKNS
jgi:hypothetical protein